METTTQKPVKFLSATRENADFNQYWYSAATINAICAEFQSVGAQKIACIACPSVFFCLKQFYPNLYEKATLLDIDTQWKKEHGFIRYDYKEPLDIPGSLQHTFDGVVIDPPFITRDAWIKFAEAGRLLGTSDAHFICSSIAENAAMLKELLGVSPVLFKPSIPNLIYQYNFYTNFQPKILDKKNQELPDD
ncbi:MAG: putative nucleic acid binding protein [Streblomastix strix]|uniref:Putative nucleic acid binding protein n=1 Tax=Streblomastix strix TaxID=222440 RepID=A0A5J4X0K8_9EUKA|nr:MAG: putative nucleic acid binding protein [Streblomastix strix]